MRVGIVRLGWAVASAAPSRPASVVTPWILPPNPDHRLADGVEDRRYAPAHMSLAIHGLVKRFGAISALDGLTFDVPERHVFGFLGSNGAGKTTTMRIALGVLRADGGSIHWRGADHRTLARHTWGYLPEERGLYPKMTVLQHLVFFAGLQGVPRD